ncbi:MAG: protein kinase [Acidobacteriota bacterium]
MTLSQGTRLGHYEILSPIGVGGMGEVYLARDTRLERKVAIKLLTEPFKTDENRLRRFMQEARAASALNHPNILTIYEIGETDGVHFIATEYIEGETLRGRLQQSLMSVTETLEVVSQAANALAAAHQSGIIHRDVKPENLMLRPDGYVKVLDFGLAKLSESEAIEPASNTLTGPGIVMGTARYMSPEQARGQTLDARTDIFSLGITLYEMLTGRTPFRGESAADVFASILHQEPEPFTVDSTYASQKLHYIINKALAKDREARYQTMKEMLADLKDLQNELATQSKQERFATLDLSNSKKTQAMFATTMQETLTLDNQTTPLARPSSAEYLITQIKIHKRSLAIALGVLVFFSTAAYFYLSRKPALTEQDAILLADFTNTTGDAIFDGTLKQGLAVQLQQSPFFNIFPEARARQTLLLMKRSEDERITQTLGREICERQGLKALIAGAIAPLGTHYVITLEAINAKNGEVIAREQSEAESKEGVLKTLSSAASRLREKLGESLASLQKFDAPLEVTTASLDALKALSLGEDQQLKGKYLDAVPFFKRAVELDPNFAYAWGRLGVMYYNTNQPRQAAQAVTKAYGLQDRVSALEKLRIKYFYYALVTGELDKGIAELELYKQTYPRDWRAPAALSDSYLRTGRFEESVAEGYEALRLDPNAAVAYWNLCASLMHLNRFAEVLEVCDKAFQQKLDTTSYHTFLYQIAFINSDAAMMQSQLDWASGKADEYVALDWQTGAAIFAGEWQTAQDFSRRAVDLATRSNAREVAARYSVEQALRAAMLGDCETAKRLATEALALERNQVTLARAALALAWCGEARQAQTFADELAKTYPQDVFVNALRLPLIQAAIELKRGNAAQALQALEAARRYESVAEFLPQTLRGEAYLQMKAGAEATAEFQKILNHRGEAPLSMLYTLAYRGLGRAAALSGDVQKSRENYQAFFAIWKNRDSQLPVILEARGEQERLP